MSDNNKGWLHSDIYDGANASEPLTRTSLFKFGTFRNFVESFLRFLSQIFIAGFLFSMLFLLFTDPAMQEDDLYFVATWEIVKVICVTISVLLASKIFSDIEIADLGLKLDRQALQDSLMGFVFVAVLFIFEFFIFQMLGWFVIESVIWETQSFATVLSNTLLMLFVYVLVGWSEELLSRGFHLRIFSRGLNRPLGILLSSALFAFLHTANPGMTDFGLLFIFLAGTVLAMAFLRTGQLWLAMGIHAGWDFFVQVGWGQSISGLQLFHLMDVHFQSTLPNSFIFAVLEFGVIAFFVRFYTAHCQPRFVDW